MADYYAVLEIDPSATQDEVRAAYKRQALRYHPDRSNDPDANERMKTLNEAYEIIGDPQKRAQYDQEKLSQNPISVTKEDQMNQEPVFSRQSPVTEPYQPYPDPRLYTWLIHHLYILFQLVIVGSFMFLYSLITGRVDPWGILLLLLLALAVILSAIWRIRDFAFYQG